MVDYLPRSAWGARPARSGPGKLTPSRVKGVALHWPGTTSHTPIASAASVASALRGWQDYHMDGRGWSDIAYQVAVDQAGRAWTLRGITTQSGANGDNEVNEEYGAILLVLVQGEPPSAAMIRTAKLVVADFRIHYPKGQKVVGHKDIRPEPTDCPGPLAYAALKRGAFTPGVIPTPPPKPPVTPPKDWFDMATPAEIETAVAAGVEAGIRSYMKDFFTDEQGTGDTLRDEANDNANKIVAAIGEVTAAVKATS